MSIAAQRFDPFAKEFNIPTADFGSLRDIGGLLNRPLEAAKGVLADIKAIFDQFKNRVISATAPVVGFIEDLLSSIGRMAKSGFDTVLNLASLTESAIGDLIESVFSGFPREIINAVKAVGRTCRDNSLGAGIGAGLGVKVPTLNCNNIKGGTAECDLIPTAGIFNALGQDVAGGISRGVNAIRKGVQALVSLLTMGYSANLCNVFAAAVVGLGIDHKGVMGIAAAAALNHDGKRGSINALLDIPKNDVSQVARLSPSVIRNSVENISDNIGVYQSNAREIGEKVTASLEALDSNWNLTDSGEILTSKVGKYNKTMDTMLTAMQTAKPIDTSSLTSLSSGVKDMFSSAYSFLT